MGKDETVYFLLVYSFDQVSLVHKDTFRDRDQAIAAYDAKERDYRGRGDKFEIVLIGGDSIETVMQTHGHYFTSSENSLFSEFLVEM